MKQERLTSPIPIRIGWGQLKRLKQESVDQDRTVAYIIRLAIAEYLAERS